MVHGPVREVVRGAGPQGWSTDCGLVFSGHPVITGPDVLPLKYSRLVEARPSLRFIE